MRLNVDRPSVLVPVFAISSPVPAAEREPHIPAASAISVSKGKPEVILAVAGFEMKMLFVFMASKFRNTFVTFGYADDTADYGLI